MHSIVTQVDGGGLLVRDQDGKVTRYEAGTVLWAAGVAAPGVATAIAKATGAKCDRAGRIMVGKDLTVPGYPEIYVPGDLMSLEGLPGVAEVAMQGGLYAGRHIGHAVEGRPLDKPFRYRDLGTAAYISRGSAVVSVGKLHFSGFIGWWGFLTGYRNRIGAILSWWFAFTRDLRRERTYTVREVGLVRDVYSSPPPGPANGD